MDYLGHWRKLTQYSEGCDNMKFVLTSPFGVMEEIRGLKPHSGIDLGMPEGTQLRSAFDGVVEKVWDHSGAIGNGVKIQMEDGTHSIYGHMKEVDVRVGEHINSGDPIGLSGNTGNSTGPHLHFGMQKEDGSFMDPSRYVEHVSNMSGGHIEGIKGIIPSLFDSAKTKLAEETRQKTIEITMGIFDGLTDILAETIGAISLVGCTVLIIMKIAGYDKGYKQAGMLFVFNILSKMFLTTGGPL